MLDTKLEIISCVPVLDESQVIYGVKNVTAIPLLKDGANHVLSSIRSRNALYNKPFPESYQSRGSGEHDFPSGPHPKGPENEVDNEQLIIPVSDIEQAHSPPSPTTSSGATTPTSSEATSGVPISVALSNRLSSWTRLPRRTPTKPGHESSAINTSVAESAQGSSEAVAPTVRGARSFSVSTKEQYAELEDRVIRGCIREYTKGCMFFAYRVGTSESWTTYIYNDMSDLTRSLQHKFEQSLKSCAQDQLLATLDALSPSIGPSESDMNSLLEPLPKLPLWRRVDRQFWWNEHISRPFIDAGVSALLMCFTMSGQTHLS